MKTITRLLLIAAVFVMISAPVKAVAQNTGDNNVMSTGSAGLDLLKSFEDCRLEAYKALSTEQYYTIGWGHYGADVYEGMEITQEQADEMLVRDLKKYEGYLNAFLDKNDIKVNQSQYDALVSFTYNLGNIWASSKYPTFQLKTFLIDGVQNYSDEQVRDAFTTWNRSGGQVLAGLTRRRNAEADLFLSDKSTGTSDRTKVKEFVKRLYLNFLGRESDEKGLVAWTNVLCDKSATGAKVVYGFVYSPEFQNNPLQNDAFVTAMYMTILGREPDEGGLSAWVRVLENGCTRKKVLSGFLNSEEMKQLCFSMGILAGNYESDEIADQIPSLTFFVTRMYRTCLDREPDKAGLESWIMALADGRTSGRSLAHGFFFSDEMKQKGLSNRDFATAAYIALLDREPDEGGLNSWTKALDEGAARTKIVDGFVGSPEFRKLCEGYGIS